VSLGALGVISTVTLGCVPSFHLEAREEGADLDETLDALDEHIESNEHFEFFWFPHTTRVYRKRNNRTDAPPTPRSRWKEFRNDIVMENLAFGAAVKVGKARPEWIPRIMRDVVASGLGRKKVVQASYQVFATPRLVRFAEMEYAIPRRHARRAILDLRDVIDERGFLVNFPVEVRFVAPDDILLSPAHGRETCYIAVHLAKGMDHEPYFRAVEDLMMSYDGRPHWGKLHFREAYSLRHAYPRFDDFVAIRDKLDPQGRFRNPYLDRVLGPPKG
jgi:L-gulonolactone oxidase